MVYPVLSPGRQQGCLFGIASPLYGINAHKKEKNMTTVPDLSSVNLASTFLYGVGGVFTGVLAYQTITGRPLDIAIFGVVTGIVGFVTHANGNQQGTNNANNTVAKTAIAQFPLTQEGIDVAATQAQKTGALSNVQPTNTGQSTLP
jgi:hypothetical protein